MKAAQINSYGGEEVLQTVNSAPKPSAGPGQVLVEVHAAGVNPFDYKVREGFLKDSLKLPATLGGDVAGVVAELGEGVTDFQVGQVVFGQANAAGGQGSYAEFTPVKAESLAPKPDELDFVTAAAIPLAGCSAYQALVDHLNLQAGQKILIHGGAGGIGSYAVQLAKHLGAYVATTAAAEDAEYAKSLGADEIIDYKTQAFETILQDYDAVFDTVGGESFEKSFRILKRGGMIVSMVASNEELAAQQGVTAILQSSKVTAERLAKVSELVEQGVLKVNVDKVFPLDQAAEALEYIHQGKHRGKVVITVK